MEYKDYYKALGLEKGASAAEIKKAYRRLAKEFHPDTATGDKAKAEQRFKEISEAYEVLGDEEKRKKYDELEESIKNGSYSQGFGSHDFGGDSYTYTWSSDGDDAYGFSDFFNMFFGGEPRGAGRGRGFDMAQNGQDVEAEVTIGIREACLGAQRTIRVGGKTISVNIPAGILSGERIRLANQGYPGKNGGRDGSLYLRIKVEPAEGLTLSGLDLEREIDLYPWEAALGCTKTVDALDSRLSVNIPAGIQSGKRIRLRGRGFKSRKGGTGDLYAKIRIVNPPALTKEAKELFEKLKREYE